MADTLLALITAHLIADFPLQNNWLLAHKKKPLVLVLHIVVVTVAAALLLGALPLVLLAILAITHLTTDAIKVHILKDTLASFFADQIAHLIVIAGLAATYPGTFVGGFWAGLSTEWLQGYQAALCLLAGIILSLQTGAIIIKKATQPFLEQIGHDIEGLRHGGAYIGCLERALVMLLVLINQPAGVGFLITAKSILRFGDVKESHQRKLTEYVIIGTFLSFGWGLLVATITQLALKHWMP
jgi:hypothetical protein